MTDTSWGVPGAATYRELVPEIIEKSLATYFENEMILSPLMGTEGDMLPFVRKSQLMKEAGDTIKIGMQGNLTGVGKIGDVTLEASEERLLFYDQAVYVNQWRNAVTDDGAMTRQRDNYGLHERSKKALSLWYAKYFEISMFYAMYYNYSPHLLPATATGGLNLNSNTSIPARYWYTADEVSNPITYSSTDATYFTNIKAAEAALTDVDTDKFSPSTIEGAVAKMKVNNFPKVRYKGLECYICIAHPYQIAQLRSNTDWFNAAATAIPRDSKSNPIFSGGIFNGAVAYWNNCLILESNYVHSGDETLFNTAWTLSTVEIDSNASDVYRAIFLGSNAVAVAIAVHPHLEEKKTFDYNNKIGEAIGGIFGMAGARYISDDGNSTLIDQGRLIVSTYSPATPIRGTW